MIETIATKESLQTQGYTPVEIELNKSDMQTAMLQYMNFLDLDIEHHVATEFLLSGRGDGDYGQFTRIAGIEGGRGMTLDNKDIFHFGSKTRQIAEARTPSKFPKEMKEFLDSAEEIFWAAQRSKRQVLESFVGKTLLGVLQTERGSLNDVLRFIAYYENDNKLAHGHFDRSTATLAIGESHEGLRITPGQNGMVTDANQEYMDLLDRNLQAVEHREGEAKFFLGAGWNRIPAKLKDGLEDLPLGWHDVIPSDTNKRVNSEIMRWAMVLFINPHTSFAEYKVPTPAETRPHKKLGKLSTYDLVYFKEKGHYRP